MKRIKLMILAIALSITSVVSCYAAQPYFKDVPVGSKYYQEIQYLKKNHIINGTGGGNFRPNDAINYKDYLVMLNNYCDYGYNLYKYKIYGDVLEILDINYLTQGQYISKIDVLRQACLALDIEPYSTKFYETPANFEKFSGLEQDEKDIILMCSQQRILEISKETAKSMTGPLTRGEAAQLFYRIIMMHEKGVSFKMPDAAKSLMEINYAEEVTDYSRTVTLLNDIADLPEWLVEDYKERNMEVIVVPFSAADNANKIAGNYNTADGITINSLSNNAKTIPHEFGHHLYFTFIAPSGKNTVGKAEVEKLYQEEKDGLGSYYRDYGKTNAKEFFAEFFVLYLDAIDKGTTAELKSVFPNTYAYFDELIESLGGI